MFNVVADGYVLYVVMYVLYSTYFVTLFSFLDFFMFSQKKTNQKTKGFLLLYRGHNHVCMSAAQMQNLAADMLSVFILECD